MKRICNQTYARVAWLADIGGTQTFASQTMINLFQSAVDPEVFGFTRDATGQNLPDTFAPWQKVSHGGSLYLGTGGSSAQLGSDDPVIRAVESHGFYLAGTRSVRPRDQWKHKWRRAG